MSPNSKPQEPSASWLEERGTPSRSGFSGNDLLESHSKVGSGPQRRVESGARAQRNRQRFAQFGLAMIAGAFVGGAMLLAEPFAHRCGATLKMADASNPALVEKARNDMVAFLWVDDARTGTRIHSSPWLVNNPEPGILQLSMVTTDSDAGIANARSLAEGFLRRARELREQDQSTPSEGESFLSSYVRVLTERLDDAQKQLDAAMARLPEADPRQDKASLVSRWSEVRTNFDSARAQLVSAAQEYRRLTDQGEITEASVSQEKRNAALAADQDLQQDLKELAVTLEELKANVLTVGKESSPALEQIGVATATGITELKSRDGEDISEALRAPYATLASELQNYADEARAFTATWTAEFDGWTAANIDPHNAALLDVYQKIKNSLNDFLFRAGNRLSAMREAVNQISRDPSDDARHHLRQSDAARALAEVQSAHHRFEFSAGALDTTNNFRLDSALRIARGLRRRVSDRIRAIDEHLRKEAVAKVQEEHKQAMAALDSIVRKSREASDATVEQLIQLQDELEKASSSSEQFVAAVAAAELANQKLQLTRKDLDQAEGRLRDLALQRASARQASELSIASTGILERNVNLGDRLRVAGVGACVTFLAVLLGQIVLARALWPER